MTTAGTRRLLGDATIAVGLAAVAVVTTAVVRWTPEPAAPLDGLGVVLLAASGLVLAVRRRWPVATLAATTALITAYLLLDYPFGLIFLSFALAVYTVARYRPLAISGPSALIALAALLTHLLTGHVNAFIGAAYGSGWAVVPFALGVTVRTRHELAARAREELVRTHVNEERLRVSQEVHDIVGHGLAAIKMQADVALHVLSRKPDQAQTALDAISRTSSEALEELRATLAAVREAGGEAAHATTPGLSDLGELRRRMGEAGLHVQMEITGTPPRLPPAVDLTGYRIVQESLTNVLRHSAAHQATVAIRYADDDVEVVVTNPVDGVPRAAGGGSGIPGMRYRVEALGGSFAAGPTPHGRFEVRARLPAGAAA
jgi:signal transduction histidine kinase